MKKYQNISIVYYLIAVACYICSIVWFCSDSSGLGTMWLCIGSANLCLGTVFLKKSKGEEEKDKQEKDDNANE